MVLQKRLSQVGELHCLNCGRVLGDLVRDLDGGSLELLPAAHQSDVHVVVAGRRMLRCGYCQGRAFLEMLDEPSTPIRLAPVSNFPDRTEGRPRSVMIELEDMPVAAVPG
jgi:hypothetical protein